MKRKDYLSFLIDFLCALNAASIGIIYNDVNITLLNKDPDFST